MVNPKPEPGLVASLAALDAELFALVGQPFDLDLDGEPLPAAPRRRYRKPKGLQGLTPRHRRTKAEVIAERDAATIAAMTEAAGPACEARISAATPGQVYVANRLIRKWNR